MALLLSGCSMLQCVAVCFSMCVWRFHSLHSLYRVHASRGGRGDVERRGFASFQRCNTESKMWHRIKDVTQNQRCDIESKMWHRIPYKESRLMQNSCLYALKNSVFPLVLPTGSYTVLRRLVLFLFFIFPLVLFFLPAYQRRVVRNVVAFGSFIDIGVQQGACVLLCLCSRVCWLILFSMWVLSNVCISDLHV